VSKRAKVKADVDLFYSELLRTAKEHGRPSDVFAVRMLRLRPKKLAQLHDQCCNQVVDMYNVDPSAYSDAVRFQGDSYSINWEGLTNFLKEILPIILPVILKLLGM